ncbi:hypothetical protein BGZ95_006030 [Linnemannia exigua]|uniref:FAD-binding domain-containing protein n=1 Tax=Linnemannia exigua TaxID=604196 RepID=A0AAD4DLC7_9FUNG|nr:hypothetical protein BGZ95_006030 [Linnemannia exigua]
MDTSTEKRTDKTLSTAGFKGSELPPLVTTYPPRVLIVGAGLAGLFLGILLERAGIPYEILERSADIKPLGAVMCLSPNILPAFEQLGLYDELMSFSKPALRTTFFTGDLKVIAKSEILTTKSVGYDRILFARPELYSMLFKQIPRDKIHMSKKVLSFQQNHEGVMLRFGDNSTIHGDILVGADGAHSAIRQHLYKTLDKQGLLPRSDNVEMNRGYISLVGTTDSLDPGRYPGLLKEDSESFYVIGDKMPGNKICWNVVIQVGMTEIADEQFRSSDWVPQQNQKILDSTRHFKTPYGTLGDLFDATPIENVSKVYFEDMLFETWNYGRTILPSSGAGAVNAMQDAVVLANHLYDIYPTSFENIKTALSKFKEERFDAVKEQYPQSYISAKLIFGHRTYFFTWTEHVSERSNAGAGLGGLFLGILLEKAGIPYEIFERSAEIKPLGSVMCLPALRTTFCSGDLKPIAKSEILTTERYVVKPWRVCRLRSILFARSKLCESLFKKIPVSKIHTSKKVVSFVQDHDGVTMTFEDDTTAHGDIIVGADGNHSGVRQHLYRLLEKDGILPKSDTKDMDKGYISVVGTADALDTAKYPGLLKEDSECYYVIGDKETPHSWVTFTVPSNRICWNVVIQMGLDPVADEQFKSSDWVAQDNRKMLDSIRHFKTPYGTLGDLFDATQIDRVCKVYFEDMLFNTWNHGRAALIGDAHHKVPKRGTQDVVTQKPSRRKDGSEA